jgi:drug/metabolite transporter (DMT)-like permease
MGRTSYGVGPDNVARVVIGAGSLRWMLAKRTVQIWLALGAVWIVWSSTYLAIRVVVETLPPLLSAATRWAVAGSALYLIASRRGDRRDRPTRRHWRNAAVIGTALCLGGNGVVAMAEQRIESGTAALLVATVPLWVALFEWVRHRARLSSPVIVGLVVGFAGTAILVKPGGARAVDLFGAGLVLLAAAVWAAGSLFSRRAELPRRPLVAAGMEMICGGIACALAGSIGGELGRFDLSAVSRASVIGVGYLIVFGSLIGFTCYVWTFRNVPTSLATTYAYVNPLIAVILGALLLDERITATTVAGGLVIVLAVAIIVTATSGGVKTDEEVEHADLATNEVIA